MVFLKKKIEDDKSNGVARMLKKVTHIIGKLLDLHLLPFSKRELLRGSELFPLRAVPYGIPHWVTSFECSISITHVRKGATPMKSITNYPVSKELGLYGVWCPFYL